MRVKARMNGRQTEIIHVVEVGQRARIPFVHTTTKKRKKDSQKKKKKTHATTGDAAQDTLVLHTLRWRVATSQRDYLALSSLTAASRLFCTVLNTLVQRCVKPPNNVVCCGVETLLHLRRHQRKVKGRSPCGLPTNQLAAS
jgi:hypothetical protein